jgi:hypothetical protein
VTAPDTVVMKLQSVLELCKARNGNTTGCWWTCVGSTCPFRNAFTGHSDEDHRLVGRTEGDQPPTGLSPQARTYKTVVAWC